VDPPSPESLVHHHAWRLQELEENTEYVEREDEFDINPRDDEGPEKGAVGCG
jgi:hypothetical protein